MKNLLLALFLFGYTTTFSQSVQNDLSNAYKKLAAEPGFKHATLSLYIINTTTGKPISEVNIETGLACASTLKVVTAATAYALLGKDYRYKTNLSYSGKIENGILNGDIIISGSGDPTLGSWRYSSTREDDVLAAFKEALIKEGISGITGKVIADERLWQSEITPNGWIWQDIGNYYGAGARALNWRENQYDLFLKSGNQPGDPVTIASTKPAIITGLKLQPILKAAAKGSGDNAYIYLPLNEPHGYVRGTIPAGESNFKISGAMPNGAQQLASTLEATLKNIPIDQIDLPAAPVLFPSDLNVIYTHQSPPLDSISYWFLQKSINLYGEALLKTMASQEAKSSETDKGVDVIQKFWKKQGIEPYALNLRDGSGLSPANRITTSSLVQVLQFAKKQEWFNDYYAGFPMINGLKMKSGTIGGALAYTGFVKSKSGAEYTFAFIINNYDGSATQVRRKMWKILDILK